MSTTNEVFSSSGRRAHYYGDRDLSDVILLLDNREYHVNTHFLSSRSTYFKDLFADISSNSFDSENDEKPELKIEEDRTEFHFLLNMLYKQKYNSSAYTEACQGTPISYLDDEEKADHHVYYWWHNYSNDIRLAKKFKVDHIIRPSIERQILLEQCTTKGCISCTARALFALNNDFHNITERFRASSNSLAKVLTYISRKGNMKMFTVSSKALYRMLYRAMGWKLSGFDQDVGEHTDYVPLELNKTYTYGIAKSDVTLVVENCEFEVHKMHLASRSSYFNSLFFMDLVEKDKDKITIKVDADAFKGVMDIFYNGEIDYATDFLCNKPNNEMSQSRIKEFWELLPAVIELFGFFDIPIRPLEEHLRASFCRNAGCKSCINKTLLAHHLNLERVKAAHPFDKLTVTCLREFHKFMPDQLNFSPADLCSLIDSCTA